MVWIAHNIYGVGICVTEEVSKSRLAELLVMMIRHGSKVTQEITEEGVTCFHWKDGYYLAIG